MSNPFDSDQWIKNCIASGAITPPKDSDVERVNKYTMYAVWIVVTTGEIGRAHV